MPSLQQLRRLRRLVVGFYRRHARRFPWRRTRDPYKILVAEVMLQQTGSRRVIPKYREFLRRFPTLRRLARAPLRDVVRIWVGLGYNVRAVRLWRCARMLTAARCPVPNRVDELVKLPGIGAYTAAAVACFAFGFRVAAIDVNVSRVLTRALAGRGALGRRALEELAERALPHRDVAAWTQGLMDIGALFCRRVPRCAHCPLRSTCAFARAPRVPVPPARPRERFVGSRRYYRGRIVRALATVSSLPWPALARRVAGTPRVSRSRWWRRLLESLERDGLIRLDPVRRRVRAA
jgi:A/G-specific adenine glycosylase